MRTRTLAIATALTVAPLAGLQAAQFGAWEGSGDLRGMYVSDWRDTRDGGTRSEDAYVARFRYRLKRAINENWTFQTRFATSWADRLNDPEFYIRSEREFGVAIEPGTATLDEFFLKYTAPTTGTEVTFGRFQSNLDLPQMATRSFDRSQASSVNIGWTDGISIRQPLNENWYGEITAQYNSRNGNGHATRELIDFQDEDARIGWFGVLGSDAEVGPIFMRAFSITVYPDSLAPAGTGSTEREDYVLGAFKIGAGWDVDEAGRRLVAVGELAHAINTPDRAAQGLPGSGDVGGWGWQAGLDLVNVFPRHTWGLNYGQSDGGMLISNDFRQNNELAEFRWQWKATSALRLEFRARWRRELELRAGAVQEQRDRDVRLRFTYKF